MRTGKGLAGAIAIASVSLLVITACSSGKSSNSGKSTSTSFADCVSKPTTCNSGKVKAGGSMTYTIEKTVTGWNVNNGDTNTFDFQEVLDGVLPSAFTIT